MSDANSARSFYQNAINHSKYVLPFVRRLVPSKGKIIESINKNSRSRQYAPYKLQENWYKTGEYSSQASSSCHSKDPNLSVKYQAKPSQSPVLKRRSNRSIKRNTCNLGQANRLAFKTSVVDVIKTRNSRHKEIPCKSMDFHTLTSIQPNMKTDKSMQHCLNFRP